MSTEDWECGKRSMSVRKYHHTKDACMLKIQSHRYHEAHKICMSLPTDTGKMDDSQNIASKMPRKVAFSKQGHEARRKEVRIMRLGRCVDTYGKC